MVSSGVSNGLLVMSFTELRTDFRTVQLDIQGANRRQLDKPI